MNLCCAKAVSAKGKRRTRVATSTRRTWRPILPLYGAIRAGRDSALLLFFVTDWSFFVALLLLLLFLFICTYFCLLFFLFTRDLYLYAKFFSDVTHQHWRGESYFLLCCCGCCYRAHTVVSSFGAVCCSLALLRNGMCWRCDNLRQELFSSFSCFLAVSVLFLCVILASSCWHNRHLFFYFCQWFHDVSPLHLRCSWPRGSS